METSVSFYSDPIFGPNYHVTSRLNSPSKNVLSNYNILQSYKSQESHVRKIKRLPSGGTEIAVFSAEGTNNAYFNILSVSFSK